VTATSVLVHVILDNPEKHKVACHHDYSDDPGQRGHTGCEDGTKETRAKGKEKCDEGEATGNRMEDHDAGQGFGGVNGGLVEMCVVDAIHDDCWIVANLVLGAVVLVGGGGSNIENAVPECPKCDRGMASVGCIGESHLQKANIIHNWRGDGSDEEEDTSGEEEESADMVENASFGHFEET